jgi:hypothetical protein
MPTCGALIGTAVQTLPFETMLRMAHIIGEILKKTTQEALTMEALVGIREDSEAINPAPLARFVVRREGGRA